MNYWENMEIDNAINGKNNLAFDTKKLLSAIIRWDYFPLLLICAVLLAMHFYSINLFKSPVFDERFYILDANSIIDHQSTLRPEHPPLGKLFIAAGIHIFGDGPLGWRFFSVIFGITGLVFFFFICRQFGLSWRVTNIATFLLGFENLRFIQSNMAMLDVYFLTFMLAALLCYFKNKYYLAGFFAGLSMLSKLPGVMVLGIIFIYWLVVEREKWKPMIITLTTAVVAFFVLMPLLEYSITSTWQNPVIRLYYMLNSASMLNTELGLKTFVSQPWEWLMNKGTLFYCYNPQSVGMISLTISIMIIPCVLFLFYKAIKRNKVAIFGLIWFFFSYISWILISLVFNRLMYIFYFYPVVVSICLGTSLLLSSSFNFSQVETNKHFIGATRCLIGGYLFLHFALFILFSPLIPSLVTWIYI